MTQSHSSTLVVYADLPHLMNDNVLNREYMSRYHGGEALTDMAEAILRAGFEFMTIDRYLTTCPRRRALLVSHMATGLDVNKENLVPAVCYSLESPIIASRYYHHIRAKTEPFANVYDWAGVAPRINSSRSRFLPISWPTTIREVVAAEKWDRRRFLVMINSNKRALQWAWPGLRLREVVRFPRALVSNVRTTWIKFIDPFMGSEVYLERLRAIQHLSKCGSFDLYGGLWDTEQKGLSVEFRDAIRRCYRGAIPDKAKLEYLRRYKFSVVFENTVFPGYVTEKIFDCFFAGVIPVYLGDPRITERIPSACFIDARAYSNYKTLVDDLLSMPAARAMGYLDSAREFVASSAFEPFTSKNFAETIVNCLNEVKLQSC